MEDWEGNFVPMGGMDKRNGMKDGQNYGLRDVRKDWRLEILPFVLQDIGPLGPLPKKHRKRLLMDGETAKAPYRVACLQLNKANTYKSRDLQT